MVNGCRRTGCQSDSRVHEELTMRHPRIFIAGIALAAVAAGGSLGH